MADRRLDARSVEHIETLMKDGEQQAGEFLTQRRKLAF
jgi:hypothetical protein